MRPVLATLSYVPLQRIPDHRIQRLAPALSHCKRGLPQRVRDSNGMMSRPSARHAPQPRVSPHPLRLRRWSSTLD